NYIGANAAGTAVITNGHVGISVAAGAANNILGGGVAGAGNVIVATNAVNSYGIALASTSGNIVQGNFIGTTPDGSAALGQFAQLGIDLESGAKNNLIGSDGSDNPLQANVIVRGGSANVDM